MWESDERSSCDEGCLLVGRLPLLSSGYLQSSLCIQPIDIYPQLRSLYFHNSFNSHQIVKLVSKGTKKQFRTRKSARDIICVHILY